uniref:Fucosyltransferase n=1 Tax=Sinocyclocheilus grahami TaxID=75366 RepID=A0A672T7R4_SINGR
VNFYENNMWPFGNTFGFGPCSSAFDIHGCHLWDDRALFNQGHGGNLPLGYSSTLRLLHCNFNPNFKRLQYYAELVKYINVSAFGRHFKNPINGTKYSNLVSICKFYLSFENSIHRDYVTEKLFNALALGAVPVVLGPSRENYELFIPSKAFIHVDDFPSPKELADHLKLLDQNEDLYKQYFTWREHFVSTKTLFGLEHACRICDHIRRNKHYKVVKDLNSWFWG